MRAVQIVLIAIGVFLTISGNAQCRTFFKKHCAEAMSGYVASENFNAARLTTGDQAELIMTFSKGEDYRLLVCSHPILGEVSFQVRDADQNVLYDNKDHDMSPQFDFQVAGTQDLTIAVEVLGTTSAAIEPQGCVAVVVGKKLEP